MSDFLKRRRPSDANGEDEPGAKKPKSDSQSGSQPGLPDPKQIAAMLAEKQREINAKLEALKKNHVLPSTPPPSAAAPTATPSPLAGIIPADIQRKIEEARAKLEQSRALGALQEAQPVDKSKRGLKFEYDPKAIASIAKQNFATTKANQRIAPVPAAAKLAVKKEIKIETVSEEFADPTKNPYYDPTLAVAAAAAPKERVARGFKFVQPGKFLSLAAQQRAKLQLEKLKADIAESVKKTGMEAEMDLVSDQSVRRDPPPPVEWWDAQLVPNGAYDNLEADFSGENPIITNLVQHPVPIQPPAEAAPPKPKPLMLTKKERKKLRRQRRQEAMKEKQDKIRLGLLPPEQPKVKISNLMRVLGQEAVQDPTKVEAHVRAQMAARQKKHQDLVDSTKLTDEQRKEKKRQKLQEDTSNTAQVAVFRITDLSNPQHKFKVDKNAQQYNLTGVAINYSGMNLVVVEGGPKGVKHYKNLMLRRIDWSGANKDDEDGDGSVDPNKKPNECILVWEGEVKNRSFKGFKSKLLPTEGQVKEYLEKFNAVHYWEAARNWVSEVS
ncbi:hypothetical protein HK104_009560 [Borealophlyctis nickersoniae]|nr:hypothetical protein HK104_009560 [Borealophlyctis nickersoniae]